MATPSTPAVTKGTPTKVQNSTNTTSGFYYFRKGNLEFPMVGAMWRNRVTEQYVNVGELYENDFTDSHGNPGWIPNWSITAPSTGAIGGTQSTTSDIAGKLASNSTDGVFTNSILANDRLIDALGETPCPPRDELITVDYFVWYVDNDGAPGAEVGRCPVDEYSGEGNQAGNLIGG